MQIEQHTDENALLAGIQAALATHAVDEVRASLVQIAAHYIERGLTQEGADILAYVRRCTDVSADVAEHAGELWEDLERWICPRVLLDAEDFGKKAYLKDVVDYVLAGR